ncbi:MAG: 1-acyl-sn-glycerol-3-phosphate acyltransferase [Planctomycetota bacterium]|nr:MAG: 1-acyl-sn-glycerol-3-phosphate acyltransferase [Planctomycetota bacterium]REJ94692.1 MAG: 1-acyl-sn-glycerol-3-phosphate acyltransferase [Planctomycetota bacterium]REK31348.1 MAG: 1-acyl-sn-glycerol-3-phosphate acyltransferase [Planctomycetota bacterium]REK39073.1 MAG: 1-acyl-sn-glycerol-3-phosphate acyltransferase [Planctomycetota bacterium]
MNPEASAVTALLLLAAGAAILVWRDTRRSPHGLKVWFLHKVTRFFTPFVFRQRIVPSYFPSEGGGIVIANHRSPIDPMVIFSLVSLQEGSSRIRRVEFLTAREYCEIGGPLGFITRNMGVIPVERNGRDMRSVREALRRAKAGRLVGVFPEGRINTGEGLLPAIPGVAWLALHANLPVYPIYIHGALQLNSMVAPFTKFCRLRVNLGEPIDLSCYQGRKIDQELLREVTDVLMNRLAQTGGITLKDEEHSALHVYEERAHAG